MQDDFTPQANNLHSSVVLFEDNEVHIIAYYYKYLHSSVVLFEVFPLSNPNVISLIYILV